MLGANGEGGRMRAGKDFLGNGYHGGGGSLEAGSRPAGLLLPQ